MLFRVFPWDPVAAPGEPGGALFVARSRQGRSRHDVPHRFGAMYASTHPTSAVAEFLVRFRGQPASPRIFQGPEGRPRAIAAIDDARLVPLVDLDDPRELVARSLRPSEVATKDREVTQPMAERLYDEGLDGFAWWSTIEAAWQNVTLFAERSVRRLRLLEAPLELTFEMAEVREAAAVLEIDLPG